MPDRVELPCADCGRPLMQRYPFPVRYELQWAHISSADAAACPVRERDAWPVPAASAARGASETTSRVSSDRCEP